MEKANVKSALSLPSLLPSLLPPSSLGRHTLRCNVFLDTWSWRGPSGGSFSVTSSSVSFFVKAPQPLEESIHRPMHHAQSCVCNLLLRSGGLGLEHTLDNGGLLNKECAGDALLDAAGAHRATVCARDGLLALGEGSVWGQRRTVPSLTLAGAQDGDAGKSVTAVAALGGSGELLEVVDNELAAGGLHDPPAGRGRVVGRALAKGDTLGHLGSAGEVRERRGMATTATTGTARHGILFSCLFPPHQRPAVRSPPTFALPIPSILPPSCSPSMPVLSRSSCPPVTMPCRRGCASSARNTHFVVSLTVE